MNYSYESESQKSAEAVGCGNRSEFRDCAAACFSGGYKRICAGLESVRAASGTDSSGPERKRLWRVTKSHHSDAGSSQREQSLSRLQRFTENTGRSSQ